LHAGFESLAGECATVAAFGRRVGQWLRGLRVEVEGSCMSSSTTPRPPSIALLAWRQTLRDLRAGELRLLAVAVMLAVAALTAVGFFADRLNTGLARDARQLLAVTRSSAATSPRRPSWPTRRAPWACRSPPAPASPAWHGER